MDLMKNVPIVCKLLIISQMSSMKVLSISSQKWNKNVRACTSLTKNVRIACLFNNLVTKLITSALITNLSLKVCVINVSLPQSYWRDKHLDMLIMFHSWILMKCKTLLGHGSKLVAWNKEWHGFMATIQKILIIQMVSE